MKALLTLAGLILAPAVGVKIAKEVVKPSSDTHSDAAMKVAGVYGGLAIGGLALSLTGNDSLAAFGKGMMYGSGAVGGLALGDRLFVANSDDKRTVGDRAIAAKMTGMRPGYGRVAGGLRENAGR